MKRKSVFAGLFVVFLFSAVALEARTAGHFGVRGLGHSQASGVRYFGHQRFRSFGVGVHSHRYFGFRPHRFHPFGFPFGYPFGYYLPFYGYSTYSPPDPWVLLPPTGYYAEYNSQIYYGRTSKPITKANCKDSWTNKRNTGSLSSVIHSMLELQCENEHLASEPHAAAQVDNRSQN